MSEHLYGLPPVTINKLYSYSTLANGQKTPWSLKGFDTLVWPHSGQGEGVLVGVVDTGLDNHHAERGDLVDRIAEAKDFTNSKSGVKDIHGHSTHVTGTIVANNNDIGVVGGAPKAKVLIAKALGDQGQGKDSWIESAIVWCVDKGAHIINCSLGGPFVSRPIARAIEYAVEKGVLVICAAGNDGADDSVGYPGSDSRTVAVGAIDKNNNLAPFSSRGPEVDMVAYGVNILSCYINGGYGEMSGTSMACPNAAAIMANRLSYEWARGLPATKTYPQAISLFKEVCIDLGRAGRDPYYGCGVVDLAKMFVGKTDNDPTPVKEEISNGEVVAVKARWGDTPGLFVYRRN